MARAEEVVERIRHCLSRYDGSSAPAEARAVAEAYAEAVEQVNARVRRCVNLLRRGQRSDAIYQAELPPPVVEEAAVLDLPERDRWFQFCHEQQLGPVPEVDTNAVVELDDAYTQEQAVEPLLRAHRRLAIGHGPLAARIRVVRRLAHVDPDNPIWPDAVRRYEAARHKELEDEVFSAHQHGDLETLRQLQEEVIADDWIEPPRLELRRDVERRYLDLRDRDARHRLNELSEAIAGAHDDEDLDRTTGLVNDWQRTVEQLSDAPPATPAAVAAARDWVEQQRAAQEQDEAFNRACAVLEAALDHNEPATRIERLWATLTRFERPIPSVLASRFRSRMAEQRLEARRRFQMVFTGVLAALLLLGAGVGFLVYRNLDARRAAEWEQRIEAHVASEEWEQADQLLARLEEDAPDLRGRPAFEELALSVEAALTADELRLERFETAMARAERAPMEEPDYESLDAARELARTDAEQLRVERLTADIEQAEAEAQQAVDAAFTDRLDRLHERFAAIRRSDDPNERIEQRLVELAGEAADALDADLSPPLYEAGKAFLETVDTEAEGYARRMDEARQKERLLADIRDAHADPLQLAEALAAFADTYPDDQRATDFAEAAERAKHGADVERVQQVLAEMGSVRVATAEDAGRRLARVETLLEETAPDGPYADDLQQYRDYLERARTSLDPETNPDRRGGPVDRLLSHRLVEDLLMLTTSDGRRHYIPPDFAPEIDNKDSDPFFLRYIGSPDQRFTATGLEETTLSPEELIEDAPMTAPQSAFAERARQALEQQESPWESRHTALAATLAEDDAIDPVLRVMLLRQFLSVAEESGWRTPEVGTWRAEAERIIDREINWLAPDDRADAAREEAEQLIAALPDVAGHEAAVQDWADQLDSRLSSIALVGCLGVEPRRDGEPPTVISSNLEGRTGTLLALAPDGSGGPMRFKPLADVTAGQPNWRADAASLPLGTLVYFQP